MAQLADFIRGQPEAELHLHIEGSLEPEQMFAFARRNRIALPLPTVEAVRAAYAFRNPQDFLDIYHQGGARPRGAGEEQLRRIVARAGRRSPHTSRR